MNRKIHKISGLIAGVVILILSITGLFLNHDNFANLFNHVKLANPVNPDSVFYPY